MICECKICGDNIEIGGDWDLPLDFLIEYGRKHFCGHKATSKGIINFVDTGEKLRAIFIGLTKEYN